MTERQLLQSDVLGKLRSLRATLRGRLVLEGLAWLIVSLAGLVVVTLGFDYLLRLERALRVAILCGCGVVVLYIFVRRLIAPLLVSIDIQNLALLVERRNPTLADRLIGALQLADLSAASASGMSTAMIRRMADEANDMTRSMAFGSVVEKRRLGRAWLIALGVILLLGSFSVARSDIMGLWFQRNILLRNIDWPQDTYLSVFYLDHTGKLHPLLETDEGGKILHRQAEVEVLRGEDLDVIIETADGTEVPASVGMHVFYPSVGDTEEAIEPLGQKDADDYRAMRPPAKVGRTYFRKRFLSVPEAFRFHVTGGDDRRDARLPHQVRLVPPPTPKEVRFTIAYPAYMRRSRQPVLDAAMGTLSVPLGSAVHVQLHANKDIESARILLDDEVVTEMSILASEDGQTQRRQDLVGSFVVGGENLSALRTLQFQLTDTEGYSNRRGEQYIVQVVPDETPKVTIRNRAVRTVVCPSARIPLIASAEDDYGVQTIELRFSRSSAPSQDDSSTESQWSDPQAVADPIEPGPELALALKGEQILDIEPMGFQPGDSIRAWALGKDYLPAEYAGPNIGRSNMLSIRVIAREDLLGQLVAKQKEVRVEFSEAIKQQAFARNRSRTIVRDLADGEMGVDIPRLLEDGFGKQGEVKNECTKAADTLEAVALEIEYNRVGKPEDYQLIRSQIVDPLRNLLGDMRLMMDDFDRARSETDPAVLREEMTRIAETQEAVLAAMEAILPLMQRGETRLELARKLEILRKSAKIRESAISDEVQKAIESILGPGMDTEETETDEGQDTPSTP